MSVSELPSLRGLRELEAQHQKERAKEGGFILFALIGLLAGGFLVARFSPFASEVGQVSPAGWVCAGVVYFLIAGSLVRKWAQTDMQRKMIRDGYRKDAAAFAIGSDYILLTEGENVATDNPQ